MNHEPCTPPDAIIPQDVASSSQPPATEATLAEIEQPTAEPIIAENNIVALGEAAVALPHETVPTYGPGKGRSPEIWTPERAALAEKLVTSGTVRKIAEELAFRYPGGDADDLIQEMIMRLARSRCDIDPGPGIYGLVRKVMEWVIHDAIRHLWCLLLTPTASAEFSSCEESRHMILRS